MECHHTVSMGAARGECAYCGLTVVWTHRGYERDWTVPLTETKGTDMTNLYRDFEWDRHDRRTLTRTTDHGVFRAVVEYDDYPHAPEFDLGCPIVRIDFGYGGTPTIEMVEGEGGESAKHDGLSDNMDEIIRRRWNETDMSMNATLDEVNRWLRTFHGGSLITFYSSIDRGSPAYVAYDTRAMRERWGLTGEALETSRPDGGEWQAYIDGEVYVLSVEKAIKFDSNGEPVEWETIEGPVGGYYGDDYAARSAADMLDYQIERAATRMLPLMV